MFLNPVNCPNGPNNGDRERAIYHPNDITGNLNKSALNLIYDGGADGRQKNGAFTATLDEVDSYGIGWSGYAPDRPHSSA